MFIIKQSCLKPSIQLIPIFPSSKQKMEDQECNY